MGALINKQLKTTGLLVAIFTASGAWGQITPGEVTETLKRPIELQQPAPAPEIEKQTVQPPATPGGGPVIKVSKFVFSGNTVFPSAQLAELLDGYLNRPITLSDVYAAADRIADFYASKGYTLASVNVPPQKIADGSVLLEISEGVIGKISVEGSKRSKPERLIGFLGEVKSGQIYQGAQLEQGMRQLNELPGLSARAVVRPGSEYGTTDLIIKTEEKRVEGNVFVDNYGTKQLGETRFGANLILNNPTGVEDQLNVLLLRSEKDLLAYGVAYYSLPLNFNGSRLSLSYSQADFEVPGSTEGTSRSGKVAVEHPLIRQQRDRVDISVGVSRTNSEAFLSGTPILISGTSITLLEAGATYNHVYGNAAVTQVATLLASNFGKSETAAEARPLAAKATDAGQRLRLELDAQHLQPLSTHFFTLLHVNGVYSPDPLSNIGQFSIGGPQTVRGFAAAELRGDRGYYGQINFGRNFDLGPTKLTGRVFADSGRVLCAAPAADCTASSLSSAGVGGDFAFSHVSAKVDYSYPIGSHVSSDGRDHGRVFGSLFVNF